MTGTILEILGALGMFLFGMKIMSEGLQKLSGDKLRAIMRTMATNRFTALLTGLLVTCLVQSSSATTVMIVSFVNASLLTITEAVGMIMGANLGTTTTAWLVGYFGFSKFSMSALALPIMGIALPLLFIKRDKFKYTGEFLMGFGLLFLGLAALKDATPDINNNTDALAFIQNWTGRGMISVLVFFVFGTVLTIIVQSSSVAAAITATMAFKGWIDYPTAAAILLGENIGTTITANLAALSGNTDAKRAAFAHFIFNVIGVIWAILLFNPLVHLVDGLVPGESTVAANIPVHMAAFHTAFNLLNIVLLIGFVPQLARLVTWAIRPKNKLASEHVHYESGLIPRIGELNLNEAERDVRLMADLTRELVTGFVELFENPPEDIEERVRHYKTLEQKSDKMAIDTTAFLLQTSGNQVSDGTRAKLTGLLRVIAELEDICDCGYRLVMLAARKQRKGREVPPEAVAQVRQFSEIVLRFMAFTSDCLGRDIKASDMESAYQLENFIDRHRKELRKESMRRMSETGTVIKAEMLYIDVLNNMESIGNHCINVLQSLRHAD